MLEETGLKDNQIFNGDSSQERVRLKGMVFLSKGLLRYDQAHHY